VRRLPDGRLEAALFDGIGFVKGLDHFGIPVAGKRVLVVGAGGGGHAVAAALAQRGPRCWRSTTARAIAPPRWSQRLQPLVGRRARWRRATTRRATTWSSTAPRKGLKPDDPLPFDPQRLDAGAAVVDIIMSREPTPLLRPAAPAACAPKPASRCWCSRCPSTCASSASRLAAELQADLGAVRALLAPK
jgi:shikimate dehydrogenase